MTTDRCPSSHAFSPAASILGPIGVALDGGKTVAVRCRLDDGHDGDHRGVLAPFPGFADEQVSWPDVDPSHALAVDLRERMVAVVLDEPASAAMVLHAVAEWAFEIAKTPGYNDQATQAIAYVALVIESAARL